MENITIIKEYKNTKNKVNAKVDFYVHYSNNQKYNCYKLIENGKVVKTGNYTDKAQLLKYLKYENCRNEVYVNEEEISTEGYILNISHHELVYVKVKDNYINDFVKFCEKMQKKYECCDYISEYCHYNKWGIE